MVRQVVKRRSEDLQPFSILCDYPFEGDLLRFFVKRVSRKMLGKKGCRVLYSPHEPPPPLDDRRDELETRSSYML